jgi:RNA polymerase sigma-70 factor (ECF subfamily)
MHVDNTILKQIKQGDKRAFSLLVDRFQKPLFSYPGKMGLSQAIAEEVAQETFIRAWQAREKFDPARAAVITWLFTIARRLAINEFQRAMHRYERVNNHQSLEEYADEASQASLSNQEQQQLLSYALSKLPVDDRSLVALAYIKEFEFSAIAEIENIPVGTVKSRLYRIRQQLKITLNGGQ